MLLRDPVRQELRTVYWASLVAQTVKRLPTMRETRVRSLGREDPVEKKMATHSSILAWKIPWTEDPGRLQSMGSQKDTTEQLNNKNKCGVCWSIIGI